MSTAIIKEEADGSFLVVNLRGLVNTRAPVRSALEQLRLARRFNCTLVPDTPMFRGMLNVAKEHLAWRKAEAGIIEKLLLQRGEKSNGRKFSENDLKALKQYSSFSDLAKALEAGKARLDGTQGMRSFFRLSPPRGGFRRSTRRPFEQGGVLGRNDQLDELVERMIH